MVPDPNGHPYSEKKREESRKLQQPTAVHSGNGSRVGGHETRVEAGYGEAYEKLSPLQVPK
jgi:hypothetical protein